tara:strand:- start:487 stop:711 length:225 start_codon:yes stop_codon:yes gene_type:complete
MNKFIKFIIFQTLFVVVFNNAAYAYLDPGTGSVILQAIVAGVAAFFTGIVFYWKKLQVFLNKIFNKYSKNEKKK